jgi:hypothetical protein
LVLPVGVLMRREAVVSAEIFPVDHMLAEHDDLGGLIAVELCRRASAGGQLEQSSEVNSSDLVTPNKPSEKSE